MSDDRQLKRAVKTAAVEKKHFRSRNEYRTVVGEIRYIDQQKEREQK